jgi:hypothetical protein
MSEWISVKDRLPVDGEYVLVYAKNGTRRYKIDSAIYCEEKKYHWRFFDIPNYFGKYITHWMPLPEPPKDLDN